MLKTTLRKLDTGAVQTLAQNRGVEVSESMSNHIQLEVAIEIAQRRTQTKSANTDMLGTSATQPSMLSALGSSCSC